MHGDMFEFNKRKPTREMARSHYMDLGGLRYHFLDEGAGDPVVMLHGNPTWSFYYRNLALALKDTCRVIVPDHIGCGLSDKPDDKHYEYRLKRRVQDLTTLLEHLDIHDRITLIVHDWGGMIGMTYATRFPERIKRLVVLNTAAFHLPASKPLPQSLRICRHAIIGAFLIRGLNAFCRAAAFLGCQESRMSRQVRQGYLAPYDSWRNRIAVHRFVQDIPLIPKDPSYALVTEVQQGLHRLRKIPMLICWGEKDFVFDRHFLREWTRYFPEAELHRFPRAGHYVLEDAGGEVIPLIIDFFDRHGVIEE